MYFSSEYEPKRYRLTNMLIVFLHNKYLINPELILSYDEVFIFSSFQIFS